MKWNVSLAHIVLIFCFHRTISNNLFRCHSHFLSITLSISAPHPTPRLEFKNPRSVYCFPLSYSAFVLPWRKHTTYRPLFSTLFETFSVVFTLHIHYTTTSLDNINLIPFSLSNPSAYRVRCTMFTLTKSSFYSDNSAASLSMCWCVYMPYLCKG